MKKSLLKQYMHDPEAKAFIDKHKMELPAHTYEEHDPFFKSEKVLIEDISIQIANTHLLNNPKHTAFMNDYFEGMSISDLTKKYGYKNTDTTSSSIAKFKETILNAFSKKIDEEFALELRKVSMKYLHERGLKTLIVNHKDTHRIHLLQATHKNKLNYSFTSVEDRLTLMNKYRIVRQYLTNTERSKANKIEGKTLNRSQFEYLHDLVCRFRWVNNEGYFLTKGVDDALTDLLATEESLNELRLFQ